MNWDNLDDTANREIIVTRLIGAPPEFVFDLYSSPDHVDQWWGPKGFTNRTRSMNFEEGGIWDHVLVGPDGTEYENRTIYREITRPHKLVYTNSAPGDDANEFLTIITFEQVEDKTRLTVHMVFQTEKHYQSVLEFGADQGLQDTLNRLAEYTSKMVGS